jgi:hypothetical protein
MREGLYKSRGATAIAVKRNKEKRNIHARRALDGKGARANSSQTKTPPHAEIMICLEDQLSCHLADARLVCSTHHSEGKLRTAAWIAGNYAVPI